MRLSRRKVLGWGAGLGFGAIGLDAWAIEPRALDFVRLSVPIRDLPAAFEGYRIAFLTDIHVPRRIDRPFVHHALSLAGSFRPDLLLFGGDYVDWPVNGAVPSLRGYFETAAAPDGVYGVLGNHNSWVDTDGVREELARHSPIELLENRNVRLRRGGDAIALAGLDDLWCGDADLTRALAGIPPEMPRILLSHNPDTAESCPGEGRVDLQLSGHTHGGEIVFPFFGPPVLPTKFGRKFERGLVEGRLHQVYVSRGVASPRGLRFRCRPEVTGITLTRA